MLTEAVDRAAEHRVESATLDEGIAVGDWLRACAVSGVAAYGHVPGVCQMAGSSQSQNSRYDESRDCRDPHSLCTLRQDEEVLRV